MSPHLRRASLGLAISGPFSRNRRRRRSLRELWHDHFPTLLAAGLAFLLTAFFSALFF